MKFKDLLTEEKEQWVIYNGETGKVMHSMGKSWASMKDAKKALAKYEGGVIASFIWYMDNQNDKSVLIDNAKSQMSRNATNESSFKSAQLIIDNNQDTKIGDEINGKAGSMKDTILVSVTKNTMVYVDDVSVTYIDGKRSEDIVVYVNLKDLKKALR